jgi:glucokinase
MARCVVAVDVGGTSMKAALVDEHGGIATARTVPTGAAEGPDAVVARLRGLVRELAAAPDVCGVGVVVPGAVDPAAGVARFSANLGFRDVPLRDLVSSDTGLPAVLDHDVRAAGVAEATFGRLAEVDDGVLVVIGTGIAAVLRVGGQIVAGATGLPGELGHVPVYPDGDKCPCGQRGCLESYASAAAIARRYVDGGGAAGASALDIAGRQDTDPVAARVWDDAVQALALGLASTTMLLDPAVVVLAGGLAEAGDALLVPLRAALTDRVTWRAVPRVEQSPLGSRAGLHGAAILAWRAIG